MFGIILIASCCLCLGLLKCLPQQIQPPLRGALLGLLGLNIICCTFSRFRDFKRLTPEKMGDLLLHLGIVVIIFAGFLGGLGYSASLEISGPTQLLKATA